jgi:hypothetical protein
MIGATVSIGMLTGHAGAATRQLSCTGIAIEPTKFVQTPLTARLILGSRGMVSIDLGHGFMEARILSNNKIQLKFMTKQFVGEYFHYTGDLFLIHQLGRLDRLTCTSS